LITLSAGVRLYKEYLNVCHVGVKDESRPAVKFTVTHTQVNITKISQSETELCLLIIVSPRVFSFWLWIGRIMCTKGICS